jgi:hypothetical protein
VREREKAKLTHSEWNISPDSFNVISENGCPSLFLYEAYYIPSQGYVAEISDRTGRKVTGEVVMPRDTTPRQKNLSLQAACLRVGNIAWCEGFWDGK